MEKLTYIIECEELFVFDEKTDEDICQIDLLDFKNWLLFKGINFDKLPRKELIELAIKYDKLHFFEDLGNILRPNIN